MCVFGVEGGSQLSSPLGHGDINTEMKGGVEAM